MGASICEFVFTKVRRLNWHFYKCTKLLLENKSEQWCDLFLVLKYLFGKDSVTRTGKGKERRHSLRSDSKTSVRRPQGLKA